MNATAESAYIDPPNGTGRPCPLCSGAFSTLYMSAGAKENRDGVELRRCRCDFVFSKLPPYDYSDYWSSHWDACSKSDLMHQARKEGLDTLVREIIKKTQPKRVLDFGAGIGMTSMVFQSLGCRVVAAEESERYRDAHRRFGLESAGTIDREFDLIVAKDVLEHVEDPRKVLAMLAGLLSGAGHIYIRVPNVNAYPFLSVVATRGHVNHFSPRTLVRLAAECGLEFSNFVGVHDISSRGGRVYHAVFWPLRRLVPMYHQISMLFVKPEP